MPMTGIKTNRLDIRAIIKTSIRVVVSNKNWGSKISQITNKTVHEYRLKYNVVNIFRTKQLTMHEIV